MGRFAPSHLLQNIVDGTLAVYKYFCRSITYQIPDKILLMIETSAFDIRDISNKIA